MEQSQRYELDLVQVTPLADRSGAFHVYFGEALGAARATEYPALRFHAEDGRLVAVAIDEDVDGRSDPHARTIMQGKSVKLPATDVKEAFGVSLDDVEHEPKRLGVFASAGDGDLPPMFVFKEVSSENVEANLVDDLQQG